MDDHGHDHDDHGHDHDAGPEQVDRITLESYHELSSQYGVLFGAMMKSQSTVQHLAHNLDVALRRVEELEQQLTAVGPRATPADSED